MQRRWKRFGAFAIWWWVTRGLVAQDGLPNDYFPLIKGASWTYQAKVDWTEFGSLKSATPVHHDDIKWQCEITDVFEAHNIRAARLHGWPGDLGWYEPNRSPGWYVIVQVGATHYHLLPDRGRDSVWQQIVKDPASLFTLLNGGNLILETPLVEGAIFGDFAQTYRAQYCWKVIEERSFESGALRPKAEGRMLREFVVRYWTNPEETIVGFVPGLGVAHFAYRHHGTTSNVAAELVGVRWP